MTSLVERLRQCDGTYVGGNDWDLIFIQAADELDRLSSAENWFAFLKHGDDDHKAWLLEAIGAYIEGTARPEPRGKGNKEAVIERQQKLINALLNDLREMDEPGGLGGPHIQLSWVIRRVERLLNECK